MPAGAAAYRKLEFENISNICLNIYEFEILRSSCCTVAAITCRSSQIQYRFKMTQRFVVHYSKSILDPAVVHVGN